MSASRDIEGVERGEPARRRSVARLAAVQALYQIDLAGVSPANAIGEFLRHRLGKESEEPGFAAADESFFADLVEGSCARRAELDGLIAAALTPDWPLERLEVTLRAILRAGTYELAARADVPARVVITEYLDIAHAFFSGKEPGLVNGVLDRIARTLRPEVLRGGDGDGAAASR